MKRYELAKQQGLNWQVVLVQDAETDIKTITLESVLKGESYLATNKKVTEYLKEALSKLESESIKQMAQTTLLNYASRVYLQWLNIYGNKEQGYLMLSILKSKSVIIPEKVTTRLKSLTKEISDTAYNRAVANGIYPKEYEKKVNAVLDSYAKPDYSDRYSLRAHVERELRAEYQQKQLSDLKESGVNLVWIDTHANCSERCQPFQGKLYSLDNTSGTIKGIKYKPLTEATDIYTYTKAGKAYKNGCISGFNCRHKLEPFKDGCKPQIIPKEVIERQRNIEAKQRELERKVRKYEVRALGYKEQNDKQRYSNYKALIKKWEDRYIEFSKKNNVPIYPSRLKV